MANDHKDYHHRYDSRRNKGEDGEDSDPEVRIPDDVNFDEILIDSVKSYPHLYDTSCMDYRDIVKKENSWSEIAQVLKVSPQACVNRWTRLRESFSKEKKKRLTDTKSGSGASNRRGFTYYESMRFIDKFVITRSSVTNTYSKKRNIGDHSKNEGAVNSKYVQHGEEVLAEKRQIQRTTDMPIISETLNEASTSRAFSESDNDKYIEFTDESSSQQSSPATNQSTNSFKMPPLKKGKFGYHRSIKKDDKFKEYENDAFERSFIELNKAVLEQFQSTKNKSDTNMSCDTDASFCNLIMSELKAMDDDQKSIKKREILNILFQKN